MSTCGIFQLSGGDVLENCAERDFGTEDRLSWTSAIINLAVCAVGSGGNNICTYWQYHQGFGHNPGVITFPWETLNRTLNHLGPQVPSFAK